MADTSERETLGGDNLGHLQVQDLLFDKIQRVKKKFKKKKVSNNISCWGVETQVLSIIKTQT